MDNITVLHERPLEAARFVRDALSGVNVDEDLCFRIRKLDEVDNQCERVASGGVVFQFVKPSSQLPGSQKFFAAHGNQVYSYVIAVDDVDEAIASMERGGAKIVCHRTGDDRLPYHAIFEGEGDPIDYGVADATALCGLRFEFVKKNPQLPCQTGVRYPQDLGVFQHAEIVVPDAAAAADFMCDVMGAERTEQTIYETITSHNAGCVHVLYGGIVFQLIEPHPNLLGWKEHMDSVGPSTRLICYHFKNDLQAVVDRFTARGAVPIRHPPVGGIENSDENDHGGEGLPIVDTGEWAWLYGPDGDVPRKYKFLWMDALEPCGVNWEMLDMSYRWPSSTGYFFSWN